MIRVRAQNPGSYVGQLLLIASGAVVLAVGAELMGRGPVVGPIVALAAWLSLLLVVRPYVYERFGEDAGRAVVLVMVLGPFAIFAAPVVLWDRGGAER